MAISARLLKACYAGNAGDTVELELQEFERLRLHGYAALVKYETAARVTPESRGRGRPKKK